MALSIIIVAAGAATRFGSLKQLELLNGLPLFLHSARRFLPMANELLIAVPKGKVPLFQSIAGQYGIISPLLHYIEGGDTRTESVRIALSALNKQDGFVAIHDAARPLATRELLQRLLTAAKEYGAAAPGTPLADTLLAADGAGNMSGAVPRENLWRISTPQVFQLPLLKQAYDALQGQAFTDDTQVFFKAGGHVHFIPENCLNLKITRPEDMKLAEALSQTQENSEFLTSLA